MINKKAIKLHLVILFFILFIGGQTGIHGQSESKPDVKVLSPAKEFLKDDIHFIPRDFHIDGLPDKGLESLPARTFNYIYKTDSKNPVTGVNYRLAYNHSHLYLYLEFDADRVTCRDRGYQNGDGIILVLSTPKADLKEAEELIVLGFSPTESPNHRFHKFIWKHNDTWNFKLLTNLSRFGFKLQDGKVGYEIRLAWQDVYPYHPWAMKEMGFNLFFTKAVGDTQTNWHGLVFDITRQHSDLQKYTKLHFQPPRETGRVLATTLLDKNHANLDEEIAAKTYLYSPKDTSQTLLIAFFSGEDQRASIKRFPLKIKKGFNTLTSGIDLADLIPGGYKVTWFLGDCKGDCYLTVLPKFSKTDFEKDIQGLKNKIAPGSINTLLFKTEEIAKIKKNLRPYDRAFELRKLVNELSGLIRAGRQGDDIPARSTGYVRRAFISGVDGKLWPYTIRIPKDYDPKKKYPAIVYLHGSDSDDQAVKRASLISGDQFIHIAPHGRGPQNCYLPKESQADINEALADALKNYSIDKEKLLLAGFSMGGYGVYLTHYNNPGKYKGLIIFSGHPNLANGYLNSDKAPNFLEKKYLKAFKGVNMIILHGAKDRNCEFEITDRVAALLKEAGANVEYYVDQNVGHSPPADEKILKAYYTWLEKMTGD